MLSNTGSRIKSAMTLVAMGDDKVVMTLSQVAVFIY